MLKLNQILNHYDCDQNSVKKKKEYCKHPLSSAIFEVAF